jgi:glycosyltransferase involved in cell wall biosynthesis
MSNGKEPLVSICIPTYNSEATLGETLDSIVGQSYPRLEILVVDNASTDNTIEVARRFADPRIKIHIHVHNINAEGNFNRCIEYASGAYTAIYHADDLYLPRMVAEQVDFLESYPDVGGVLTEAFVIDSCGREISSINFPAVLRRKEPTIVAFPKLFSALLHHSNFLICPSAMVRTTVYKNDIKPWRCEIFGTSADLDVWLQIASSTGLGLLPAKLMKYRVGSGQYSATVRNQTNQSDFFRVIDYYLKQDAVRAFITSVDVANYERLHRRDVVMRSANLFLHHEFVSSAQLLNCLSKRRVLAGALWDLRGLSVFLLFLYLSIANLSGLHCFGQPLLRWLKRRFLK